MIQKNATNHLLFPNLNPPDRPDLNQTAIANRVIGYNGNVVIRISLGNFRSLNGRDYNSMDELLF